MKKLLFVLIVGMCACNSYTPVTEKTEISTQASAYSSTLRDSSIGYYVFTDTINDNRYILKKDSSSVKIVDKYNCHIVTGEDIAKTVLVCLAILFCTVLLFGFLAIFFDI